MTVEENTNFIDIILPWITILAIILGPIFAVQTQKWIERDAAAKGRKLQLFRTLMATRASRLSMDHVNS